MKNGWQPPFIEEKFLPEGNFDHSPMLLTTYPAPDLGEKPFKYFAMWKTADNFEDLLMRSWNVDIKGTLMFKVVQKLKRVKSELKKLNKEGYFDLQKKEIETSQTLKCCQEQLHKHPDNMDLRRQELQAVSEHKMA